VLLELRMARDPDPIFPPLRPGTPAEVQELERRSSPRWPPGQAAFARYRQAADEPFQLALILDISAEGIGLLLANPIAPGIVLQLRLPHATGIDRTASVIHATAKYEGWLVGCEFDRPLDEAEIEGLLL
jgi:hypothetical protein